LIYVESRHSDFGRIPRVVGDLGSGARAHAIELGRRNAGPDWRRYFMERRPDALTDRRNAGQVGARADGHGLGDG
jgi:hypothetical protein